MNEASPAIEQIFAEAFQHHHAGRLAEAEQLYRKILAIDARHADSLHLLGALAFQAGLYETAERLIGKAIAVSGQVALYHSNLGRTFHARSKLEEAAASFAQALTLDPNLADAHGHLANVLQSQGKLDAAMAHYERAAALNPSYDTFSTLATALNLQGRVGEALTFCDRAIGLRPGFHAAYTLKGNLLHYLGQPVKAVEAYRSALKLKPQSARAYSNLLFVLSQTQILPPEEILTVARGFETAVCRPPAKPFTARPIDLKSKLRIGLLSAEIGGHPVAGFVESYLRHYDRSGFEVTLYSTVKWPDAKAAELMTLPDKARDLSRLTDDAARDRIIGDAVDILIETTGHTGHGRLRTLSQRCASIQCHWIGYFGTSGISAIDYYIGDDEVTPPQFSAHFSEKLFRLSQLWMVYTPPAAVPEPEQASAEDEIVLGTFNSFAKIREEVLDLWSRLLILLPTARLALKDRLFRDETSRRRITAYLASRGIDESRVIFMPFTSSWLEHMTLYNKIDIALDTFPFSSGSTAFEALYMGTPLVAMRKDSTGGRMSSAAVKALGRPEWVAHNADEYIAIVSRLAADKRALRDLKRSLRAEVLRSPLCDGASLAGALEDAFRTMAADYNVKLESAALGAT